MKTITKNNLIKLYWNKKMSTYCIAKILKISSVTIWYWLKKFKIKTRSIKEAAILHCIPFPKCIDCGVELKNRYAKRCRSCDKVYSVGIHGKNYKKGLPKCNDCGKQLSHYRESKRCCNCNYKFWKSHPCKHPAYIHGKSYEPYSSQWTDKLKEFIRKRDNYTCQKCNKKEKQEIRDFKQKLCIHHIDYNKKNCKKHNLITLCNKCNAHVNFNRKYWNNYFKIKVLMQKDLQKIKVLN